MEPTTTPTAQPTHSPTTTSAPTVSVGEASGGGGDTSSDSSSALILPILVAVAACLVLMLVAVFVRRREHPRDDKDVSLADSLTMNPVYTKSRSHDQFVTAPAVGATIARVTAPNITPAALTQRGDRLWADFRRCVSFDHMYFGNKLLTLRDEQLEDVYVVASNLCTNGWVGV